ncbi:MAG: DUF2505 domain-containing protein [Endozoicomonas sp. (ex Botrylloides leachii)]|nr:DUF2505 domain-containing protein [Endozoicomonas sp. (ex Botrylloides leachii)]
MHINQTHNYPHPLHSVFNLFADSAFIEEKYTLLGARNIKIKKINLLDANLYVDSRREMPASEDIPAVIKKFMGEWNRVRQKEEWTQTTDGWYCQFSVDILGVPVRISGTMSLRSTATGCENSVFIDINTSIPFIGETLCRFVGQNAQRLAQQEFSIILSHLNESVVV